MANESVGAHALGDYLAKAGYWTLTQGAMFTYTFENFFHPFVGELIEQLNEDSLPGMLDPDFQAKWRFFFKDNYDVPDDDDPVKVDYANMKFDVEPGGPYANYNWELFFHIPLTIAVHLSKNQRFAEAQRWFHYIFDPTAKDKKPWKFKAFRKASAGAQIDELLAALSTPYFERSDDEKLLAATALQGYQAITEKPFQPHVVARTRPVAYMYCVVMKYLDNLIAWGDHLFRQDTLETINEATQLYVLAANILGDRPQQIPVRGAVRPKTFNQLKEALDKTGNAPVQLEGLLPFGFGVSGASRQSAAAGPLFGLMPTLYFCVPRNDKLLGYWDTVADRLFKIRHCMNIQGTVRTLALFDPPLDPGMLVKAAAAGIDIGAIIAGLNQPVSPVRAQLLIQKALELSSEVRGLGSALLQVIEKRDGERLALLRQGHEININQLQQDVRFLQWKQAQEATESLLKTRDVVLERYKYYLRVLGQVADSNLAPDVFSLDRGELTEEAFDEAYEALVGRYEKEIPIQAYPDLKLDGGGSPSGGAGASGPGKLSLITAERDEIDHLVSARDLGLDASALDATGSAFTAIPDTDANLHFWGLGGTVKIGVGTAMLKVLEITAQVKRMTAAWDQDQAGLDARAASHARRADDWTLQANLAARELRQIGRQVISSLIAEQIAHREYNNIQEQIEHAQEVDRFLQEKFTSAELYAWMQGELTRLYYEYYRFAFDIARQAEQTMKRELMRPELDAKTLVKFNYWDGGRKGLLSGDALYLDVKRMEMAYHEHNLREYELTKHISLQQVDPLALISLRSTGRCTAHLPESLFDWDGPGHYFRRIKTVALSIPCVSGPYTGVHCKLTLVKSSIRTKPLPVAPYARQPSEETRFQDYFGSVQSVVASSGQQDSCLFETSLRDERYLPFENAGAISEWRLELPADPSGDDPTQFDYGTITDVVLHMRYTARDGGARLRDAALAQIKELIGDEEIGTVRLFSIRHEFPTEWARFTTETPAANERHELALTLRPEHYPFWSQGRLNNLVRIDLFAESSLNQSTLTVADRADKSDAGTEEDTLIKSSNGLFEGKLTNVQALDKPTDNPLTLYFEDAELSNLWIAVTWSS